MARITVPYQDFSGGDYGRAEAWKAPANSFNALNMYVTKTGELTVRGGLRNVTPTGVDATVANYLGEYSQNATDGFKPYVFYTYGTSPLKFRYFSPMDSTSLSAFTSLGNVSPHDHVSIPDNTYFITGGDVRWLAGHDPSILTNAPAGNAIALYLNRLVVNPVGSAQLKWSDIDATTGAPNFTSWTSTNVVSVGAASTSILAIRAQRGHLVVFKPEGIFVITGDMAVATVRQVSVSYGPGTPTNVRATRDEMLWYAPLMGGTPWTFDGAKTHEYYNIPLGLTGVSAGFAGLPTEDRAVFILSNDINDGLTVSLGWLYLNGVWTKHTFPFQLQPEVAPTTVAVLTDPSLPASVTETLWRDTRIVSSLVMVDHSTTPKFYAWTLSERPGTETAPPFSTLYMPEKAGDDSTSQVSGSVTFPEWHSQAGEEVMIRSIIVDFRAYNTGGALTNHFDLVADSLRLYNNDSPAVSTTQSYDEAGSAAATGGTLKRRVFSFGDQGLGNGFQISLTNVRGIALQRVVVVAETQPARWAA